MLTNNKNTLFNSIFAFKPKKRKNVFIFLHGFGSEYASFSRIFSLFKKKKWPFFTFNFPGHGDNESTDTDQLKLNHFVDLVCDFIVQKKLNNVILIGHSMGGAVAVLVNKVIPLKIKALILVAPMNQTSFSVNKKRILDTFFKRNNSNHKDFVEHEEKRKSLLKIAINAFKKRTTFKTLYSDMVQNAKYGNDSLERAYEMIGNKPTLVILGANDIVTPTKASVDYLANKSDKIIFKVIDGVGHSPHDSAPKLFFDYVLEFLDNLKKQRY